MNSSLLRYASLGLSIGCAPDQLLNFGRAGISLHPRQLEASAAARLCDQPDGPISIGYGGARGGGKSHWLLTQMGADDCQRFPGLKCLLIRKVGRSNLENFDDIRRRAFGQLPHEFSSSKGLLTFRNGSRIICGHFQHENDIDKYLGLEYDVIGIEEATTLTSTKHSYITTFNRTSKRGWRPRIYSTTNPGGVGHVWYKNKFIIPHNQHSESDTRFIPARVTDNPFTNPEYANSLQRLSGWQKRAWYFGDWDIAAGQFFSTFRREAHVLKDFDEGCAVEWFAAMDYGFSHYTVVLLACADSDGNVFIVDEHAAREKVTQLQAPLILEMFRRHRIGVANTLRAKIQEATRRAGRSMGLIYSLPTGEYVSYYDPRFQELLLQESRSLSRFVSGADLFSTRHDGASIAAQYQQLGIKLRPANMDRVNGWAEILHRLGDPDKGVPPKLFFHERCRRLLDCLPSLQHDPARPEDVLKVDPDDNGDGGDDAADALRYLISTRPRTIAQVKLRGL